MAHTHDLEWEVGSKRIICMYDDCDFVMEEKDIIAIIGNHAAQQGVQSDVCPSCGVDDWAYGDDTNTFEVCAMCGKRR